MTTERPVVDVGVVTWNTRDLTVSALRRLLDSDQGCELRLLVHDNGSGDGTVEALAGAVPEAIVEAGTVNLGFAAGHNRLIARSTAPFYLALNSDAWPEPGAVGRLIEAAARHPRAAAVAPRLERPDGELEHSTNPFPSLRIAALMATGGQRLVGRRRAEELMLAPAWRHDRPRRVDWAVGAALLMRREALAELGGFDERFFMYAEDIEWCWRAHRRDWEIWFEPDALVRHVGNASGAVRYGAHRGSAHMRNTYRFYRREHGLLATAAYRMLNLVGCSRNLLAARWRGDANRAAHWRGMLLVHLQAVPDVDAPPPQ